MNTVEREAYLIACRFKELKKRQLLIWDKDSVGFREVDWKDMVVLLRGVSGRTEIYAKAFHKAGVPLRAAFERLYAGTGVVVQVPSDLATRPVTCRIVDCPLAAAARALAPLSASSDVRDRGDPLPLCRAARDLR